MLQKGGHFFRDTKSVLGIPYELSTPNSPYSYSELNMTNSEVYARTYSPPVMEFIRRRFLSAFGHIAPPSQGFKHKTPYIVKLAWHPLGQGDVDPVLLLLLLLKH